jgi:hypothetical protein
MVRYQNNKYDPENPIRFDSAYAQSVGYDDILAYLSFGANDDFAMVPLPRAMRDKMLVSDLNHSITNYAPIYPGDTLFQVNNERTILDITPNEGATYRSIVIQSKGSVYNQRYEKVSDYVFRVTEGNRIYSDEYIAAGGTRSDPNEFMDWWLAPNWLERPEHYYTKRDWRFIKKVWRNERVRGSKPRYWENVKIGDKPRWTLEGPIFETTQPVSYSALGAGGSRTLKKEIMDPAIFKTMIRSEADGIYRLPDREDYIPPVPGGAPPVTMGSEAGAIDEQDIHEKKVNRSVLLNLMKREYAVRHLIDWMGDHGWLQNIRWSIMDRRAHQAYGKGNSVPLSPEAEHFLDRVPHMNGRHVDTHGLTGDIAIVKSYVYDKFSRDGEFFVDLVWWIETIEGDIFAEGGATVQLPSKSVK